MTMMPILGWRIHYSTSVVSSEEMSWDEAPSTDVQVVELLHEAPYRTIIAGQDEYELPEGSSVKYGKWMEETAYLFLLDGVVRGA